VSLQFKFSDHLSFETSANALRKNDRAVKSAAISLAIHILVAFLGSIAAISSIPFLETIVSVAGVLLAAPVYILDAIGVPGITGGLSGWAIAPPTKPGWVLAALIWFLSYYWLFSLIFVKPKK